MTCFCRSVDGVKGLYGTVLHVLLCVQELLKVFKELGFKREEKIPFSTLSQHPFLQDLMEGSSQYQLPVSVTNKYVISHTYYNRAQWWELFDKIVSIYKKYIILVIEWSLHRRFESLNTSILLAIIHIHLKHFMFHEIFVSIGNTSTQEKCTYQAFLRVFIVIACVKYKLRLCFY